MRYFECPQCGYRNEYMDDDECPHCCIEMDDIEYDWRDEE